MTVIEMPRPEETPGEKRYREAKEQALADLDRAAKDES